MKTVLSTMLDPNRRSNDAREFESALRRRIVGQDQAVEKVVEIYQMFLAGLNPPGRPVGNLLFLGPTGSGKTRVVEAMAESLFGDSHACIKIDCAEFQHSHEIAKLIGSPPGYLGHRETHPLLTQEALNQWHTEKLKLSILLFLGPTGSGKTRVVEAMAESLFGDSHACIKIDCAEFQHSHEIAKLIGSPPGYLGHRETHPLLTQEALNQWHTEKLKLSILLF